MKKILLITMLFLSIGLTACVEEEPKIDSNIQTKTVVESNRFVITDEYYYIDDFKFNIVIDTKTKNLYLYRKQDTYAKYVPMLFPLYDENGQIAKSK